jgi:2-octaprenyl-6-methoxyphenol hydroxylase
MKELKTDILIIGAGLTGLLTAYTLSRLGLNIILVDKFNFVNLENNKYDLRTTAIAEGSKEFLENINFWSKIKKHAEEIKNIKVLDRSEQNNIDFNNNKKNRNLGYIVKNTEIKNALLTKLKSIKNVVLIQNLLLKNIQQNSDFVKSYFNNTTITSGLLIAADGKNSFVRNKLNMKIYKKNYNHGALVINFNHSKDHKNLAHELFFNSGPLAILPMKNNKKNNFSSSVIWSHKPEYISSLKKINKKMLVSILEEKINDQVGEIIDIVALQSFDLSAHINYKFYDVRTIYVGDAAHSIHPIAGQGWNVGIRDIQNCFNVIKKNISLGIDVGNKNICRNYHDQSYFDSFSLFQITDKLNYMFLSDNLIVKGIRNKGFDFINKNKKLKKFITNFAMGY